MTLDEIEYRRLSIAERLVLMHDILDSALTAVQETPLPAVQLAEMDRRMDQIESGKVKCTPWNEAHGRLLEGG